MSEPLPPWDASMSDGCSIPAPLVQYFPSTPAVRAVCVRHDGRYYRGGTREDRLIADAIFLRELLEAGVNAETAEKMFQGVRAFGGPSGRQPYSWAFGGNRFVYEPSVTGG